MYTSIICSLLGVCLGIYFGIRDRNEGERWYKFDYFMPFGIGIIGFVLSMFISLLIPLKTVTVKYSCEIEAIQDNGNISGSFFLGSGHINGDINYYLYIKGEDGIGLIKIDADNALIHYSDSPHLVILKQERDEHSLQNKFSIRSTREQDNKYDIYIPKGSIRNDFTLDAK